MNINNKTAPFVSIKWKKRNPWVVLYTHIAHLMINTTNLYMAAPYLAILLLSLLTYYKG